MKNLLEKKKEFYVKPTLKTVELATEEMLGPTSQPCYEAPTNPVCLSTPVIQP